MKFHNRSLFFAIFFAVLLTSLGISSAQAAGYYYRFFSPPILSITCSGAGPVVVAPITGSIGFEWNLPDTGATIIDDYFTYGVSYEHSTFQESGSLQTLFGGYNAGGGQGYPFSFAQEYQTEINGQVVYTSTFLATCTGPGVGTTQVINVDLLNGGGAGAIGAGRSAINDGRINPENFAPVALYCDGSVLTAYTISATGGTLDWSFDLKSDSTDNPLIAQGGSALSKTDDGRFSVLASQPDGKQYLFIFDGCPSPGTTEVYISDPATGQFVRTD